MKKLTLSFIASAVFVLSSSSAFATIIGGSVTGGTAYSQGGEFIDLGFSPAGLVVGNDTFQNPNLYGFNEDQNIVLDSDLAINVGGSVIAAGIEVASHYIFFDPNRGTSITGWVEFDSEVLGIITSTVNLAASDFLLNNDVTYLNPGLRGLEAGQDSVWINGSNTNRIDLSFTASTPGDYIRVLTAHSEMATQVPEPASLLLFLAGLMGFAAGKRRVRV